MKRAFILTVLAALVICLCLPALAEEAASGVTFSHGSGFYMEAFQLEMTADEGATIYYTIDGSVPDETDLVYGGPFQINLTTAKVDTLAQVPGTTLDVYELPPVDFPSAQIIRAMAVNGDGTHTPVTSATYFVGYDRQELFGDLPIISLMIEPDDFFHYETGIYMLGASFDEWKSEQDEPFENWAAQGNYSNRGREWERPVTVDFLMPEDTFQQAMGVRIKGGVSRSAPQKSLKLFAREDYSLKNLKYPLFEDNFRESDGELLKKYKHVTLRNGGNDRGFALIRDPYISRLATGLRLETAANRPVIGLINGEFWGLYTLNEEFSDNFIDYHYGIANENVVTIKNNEIEDGEEEDEDLYWDMYDFIAYEDMTDPDLYAEAGEMLDLGSFIDFVAVTLYIHNTDGFFQDNNWELWRVREPGIDDSPVADGKWRVMLFDSDSSSGVYDLGDNFSYNNLKDYFFVTIGEDGHPAWMLESLMNNEDFKREMILSLCDVRNFYFSRPRCAQLLETMTEQYLPYGAMTYERFGPFWGENWDTEKALKGHLEDVGVFFDGRYGTFPYLIQQAFELSDPTEITLQSSDASKGVIYVNNRNIPVGEATGVRYFSEYSITVTAEPKDGATFTGWQVDAADAVVADPTALTTEITFASPFTLTAVFD